MKTILIIGGSGLLAINLSAALSSEFNILLGMHSRAINPNFGKAFFLDSSSESTILSQLKLLNLDVVINAAGYTNVDTCEKHFDQAIKVNAHLAHNLAKVCQELQIQFVHISTDHLFAGDTQFLSEDAIPSPVNSYGKSKAIGEQMVMAINPSTLVVRTNFFGWGTSYRTSFSDHIIGSLRAGNDIHLFEDVFYTPIFIDELAIGIKALINQKQEGIFNMVSSERMSKYQFGMLLANHFGLDHSKLIRSSLSDRHDLVKRPLDMSLSNIKARQVVPGWPSSIFSQLEGLKNLENRKLLIE